MEDQSNYEGRLYAPRASMTTDSGSLVDTVCFELVDADLGKDVESALQAALAGGAVFPNATDPLSIFRQTLAASIRNIESHPRGRLFQDFLLKGPYGDTGEIPTELVGQRLSDAESASAITFIYSHMVNCFKGAVAELLGAAACLRLLKQLQRDCELPADARLYVGDAVMIHRASRKGVSNGADLHILIEKPQHAAAPNVIVAGVAEVKSGRKSAGSMCKQLDRHVLRSKQGLRVASTDYPGEHVGVGYGPDRRVLRVTVQPSDWNLPRTFRFQATEQGRLLHVDPALPPHHDDQITRQSDNRWHVALKWSKEAIAAAAYEMTFWYMEKVGEAIYSQDRPKGWEGMSPAEAGRNAAKMMLYYAILRCRTARENQRAIALYNSYGFGYALGMNYRNAEGKREMLWPQDLDEILSAGKTKSECSIR